MGAAPAQSGLTAWVMANGQIIGFFAQILFWAAVGFAAVWAAATFNRFVNFVTGAKADKAAEKPAEKVSVEEFVE
jgi:hypothetical protein